MPLGGFGLSAELGKSLSGHDEGLSSGSNGLQMVDVQDGIHLNFDHQTYYTKVPGAEANFAPLQSLFTFTRNSSATFMGENGLLQWANENLALESQTFDAASWVKTNSSVSPNATAAPDGTLTADKIQEDATAGVDHFASLAVPVVLGNVYTYSIYVKAAEQTWVRVQLGTGFPVAMWAFVNLSNGTFGTVSGALNASVQNAGNGWYRVQFNTQAATLTGSTFAAIYTATANDVYAHNGVLNNGVYVWGAQVQKGFSAGAYLPTTVAAKYDQPRIEYDSRTIGTNLLLQSQNLENSSWVKSGSSVDANSAPAPDGVFTADKVVESSGGTFHLVRQDVTSNVPVGVQTSFSFYASAAGRSFCRAQLSNQAESNGAFIDVNLSNGATGSVTAFGSGSSATASATSVGNGWYRIRISCVIDSTSTIARCQILTASTLGGTNYSGNGTYGIYVYGAQYEAGTAASQYTASTSTAPVYTNNPASCLGFLSEASRINVALNSESLDNASWTKSNCTISANFGTAPNGTVSSDKVVEDNINTIHGVIAGVGVTAGSTNTLSAFVRPSGRSLVYLYGINVDQFGAIFDLTNLSMVNIISGTGTVTNKGIIPYPNGWYRVWVSGVMNGSATTLNFVGGPAISTAVPAGYTYLGDNASGVEMWGIQIEAGEFPSSYMQTAGTSFTRSADLCTSSLGSEYSATAGTIAVKGRASGGRENLSGQGVIGISDNTLNNDIRLIRPPAADIERFSINTLGVNQAFFDSAFANSSTFKMAGAWQVNDAAASFNGGAVSTDSVLTLPTVNIMHVGGGVPGTVQMNGHIYSFDYWPERLNNSFLANGI